MSTESSPGRHEPKDQTHAVEDLDHHECWRLLRSVSVGRLAVWVDDHPDIFPINYKVDHGTLVFRTAEGTKLQAATGGTPVALEADGINADTGVAWSVVIKGHAAPVQNPQEVMDTVGLLLFPWQAGKKEHFVRITPETRQRAGGSRWCRPADRWTPLDDATRSGLE